MRRRTTTAPAELYGGGPADGERRLVAEGTDEILVDATRSIDLDDLEAPGTVHRYARQPDGRFRHDGLVDREPGLPAPVHADSQAHLLAALGHDRGPHPALAVLVVGIVVLASIAFGAMT